MLNITKRLAGTAVASASLLLAAACGGGAAAPADIDLGSGPAKSGVVKKDALKGVNLTFVSYGGVYQKGQQDAAIDPFAKESGAQVLQDGPTDYAKVKAQVDSANVTWDVVDTDSIWAAAQCGKLLQPLDYKIIDKSKVPEGLATECSVPAMQYGMVLAYNKNKFGANPPQGWADFFDTAKFPGKRAIPGNPGDSAPGPFEAALVADGVAPDKLYPLDVPRATKKLDTVRADLVFWKTGAESQQLLESGEVDMVMMWSGRAYAGIKNGGTFDVQWNQWMPIMDSLAVPKNAKNPKAAMAMINYYLGAQQQAKLTELTSYSPINTDAKPKLDELGTSFLTTRPEVADKRLTVDDKWWAENQPEMIEKWSAWLGG
ncbi:ABC transporter substrate-binding protein [Nonomuraea dietziae]|uniref:Putative spermidine/putrescine transport system substrate-binding protein n=1 Tax=Nonomuraea dietziae TaxID=65515 RepID=A0A7W5Y6X3_9ACTN|nr:ABC transporter substrate-binding protein [Nonomuraea dietziae]MBB3726891.1 putative spermidine/putrescine transport system substrate-binding protein [Nonomuraea dietziae]